MKLDSHRRPADALPDRRKDQVMADLVDVGLLFAAVFGHDRGMCFFHCTIVAPHVYQRVLLGRRRQHAPRQDPDEFVPAG